MADPLTEQGKLVRVPRSMDKGVPPGENECVRKPVKRLALDHPTRGPGRPRKVVENQ